MHFFGNASFRDGSLCALVQLILWANGELCAYAAQFSVRLGVKKFGRDCWDQLLSRRGEPPDQKFIRAPCTVLLWCCSALWQLRV